MNDELFLQALGYLFSNEGGFTNNPLDSGGPTKWGVTLRSYERFVGRTALPGEIENLTLEGVRIFYWSVFWKPMRCDEITDEGIAIALFDSSVLYGVGECARLAQMAVGGTITVDGVMGPQTLLALNGLRRVQFLGMFYQQIMQRISRVIADNPKNEVFRRGWVNRAKRLLTLGTCTHFNIATT